MIYSMNRMAFQFDYLGGSTPQNLGLLVCARCTDDLNYQQKLLILPPDPAPIANTRPEPYSVDETNWITTQDGDIITTQDGDLMTPTIPSPDYNANTTVLAASLAYPGGSISPLYLDLFIGDPADGGTSILAAITGSGTRTNIASSMGVNTSNEAVNTVVITVTTAALANSNVQYIGLYDAATAGTLLVSGPVSATQPTLIKGVVVQFDELSLVLAL